MTATISMKIDSNVDHSLALSVLYQEKHYPKKIWDTSRNASDAEIKYPILDMLIDVVTNANIPFNDDIRINCADDELWDAANEALKVTDSIADSNFRLSDDDSLATLKKRAAFHDWKQKHHFYVV
jgi:hypothetical protein